MKAHEAKECHACGKHPLESGVAGTRAVTFFRVTTERFFLDAQAARSTIGLAVHFGGMDDGRAAALADVFSPDPDVFKTDHKLTEKLIVCDNCAAEHTVFALLEMASERRAVQEAR